MGNHHAIDPLRANVAMLAGMKRHSLGVRTRFYLSKANDEEINQSFAEPGLAIFFRGQVFDAGGNIGWPSIQRNSQARLDAFIDRLSGGRPETPTLRSYEFLLMPHSDPAFYHATLSTLNKDWVSRVETGTALAMSTNAGKFSS